MCLWYFFTQTNLFVKRKIIDTNNGFNMTFNPKGLKNGNMKQDMETNVAINLHS